MNPNPPLKTDPLFNVKVVVNETGLKPDTLRAWERRYGLPQPQRTKGGHRLYSAHDIKVLKWLVARQQEGMSISRAVSHLKQLLAEGIDPFATDEPATPPIPEEGNIARLREAWVTACIGYNETLAENALNQAFAMYPQELVCTAVLQKGLVEIGDLWYTGKVSVQQEHFASALAMRRIQNLITAAPPATRPESIVIGCPAGEMHEFSPLFFALFLRRRGWQVTYLGANIPLHEMQSTLKALNSDLLIMATQHLPGAASMHDTALLAQKLKLPMAFAGRVFAAYPGLENTIPGFFLGHDLSHAIEKVETLLKTPFHPASIPSMPEEYKTTLANFLQFRVQIESEIWLQLMGNDTIVPYLDMVNREFFNHIEAALRLGNINFTQYSIQWVQGLLKYNNIPAETLNYYLQTFRAAVQKWLGAHSTLIENWFAEVYTLEN